MVDYCLCVSLELAAFRQLLFFQAVAFIALEFPFGLLSLYLLNDLIQFATGIELKQKGRRFNYVHAITLKHDLATSTTLSISVFRYITAELVMMTSCCYLKLTGNHKVFLKCLIKYLTNFQM